jgi:hypothetical protein
MEHSQNKNVNHLHSSVMKWRPKSTATARFQARTFLWKIVSKTNGVHYTPFYLNQGLTQIHTFVCPVHWNVSMQMKPNVQALLICACHPNALAMQLYFHVWAATKMFCTPPWASEPSAASSLHLHRICIQKTANSSNLTCKPRDLGLPGTFLFTL